jgi:hypothetical protein
MAGHHELLGFCQFFWSIPALLRVNTPRVGVHHLMDWKRSSLPHVQSRHTEWSCLGSRMVPTHGCHRYCYTTSWHFCLEWFAHILAVSPYPRLLHWSWWGHLLRANYGAVLDIFLYTSWYSYRYHHDRQLSGSCHLPRRGTPVARQNRLWLDNPSTRVSQRRLLVDCHCLHEASATSKEEWADHRVGSAEGLTVLLACVRRVLSHAASVLRAILCKIP